MSNDPKNSSGIPGPPKVPILGFRGNLIQFRRNPIAYMRRIQKNYGEIVAFVKGFEKTVFAFGPRHNQQLLSDPTNFHSMGLPFPSLPDSAQKRITYGLFSMNSNLHQQRRRLLMPAFQRTPFEDLRDVVVSSAEQMLARWRIGQSLDVAREMKQISLLIAARTLFGLDDTPTVRSIGAIMDRWIKLSTSYLVRIMPCDLPGTHYHRMLALAETLETEIAVLIDQRRARGFTGNDIVSILIRAHEENPIAMTHSEVIGQTNVLLGAAHETTANALTWTLLLVALHPHVLSELLVEMASVLRGDAPALEQVSRLTFLDCVIKESLRLLPPIPYSTRISAEPFELGRYRLPRGTTVVYSQFITHRDAQIYPNPDKFLPERWRTIKPSQYEYLPFGAGPRICIGASFAMMTLKLTLAVILQRVRLALAPNARIDWHVTMTLCPKRGLPMTVASQKHNSKKISIRGNIHDLVSL